jgi:signal transduction histidine kinase
VVDRQEQVVLPTPSPPGNLPGGPREPSQEHGRSVEGERIGTEDLPRARAPDGVGNNVRRPGSSCVPIPSPRRAAGLARHLLEVSRKITRADWGGILLLSADAEVLEHTLSGLAPEPATEAGRSPELVEFLRSVLEQPGGVYRADVSDAKTAPATRRGLPPPGPFLAAHLACPGRCRGLLYLVRLPGSPPFGPEDEELLRPIAASLDEVNLVEKAHLLAQLQLLNRVVTAAAGNLDLSCIVRVALRELDRHLPLHAGAVWLLEGPPDRPGQPLPEQSPPGPAPSTLVLAHASTTGPAQAEALGLAPGARLPVADTPFLRCLQDGEPFYADLRRAEDRAGPLAHTLASGGATACFALPLRAGSRAVGVLQSVRIRPAGFTNEQIQLLYLVADLLGPAISNCQLFEQTRAAYEELRATQNQLIQAEKMRALGELAGGMAHDFNNSLCGVLGFLELALADRQLSASGRAFLESARTSALDAAHTVKRVQDFARNRRPGTDSRPLDVNALVAETLELTRHRWQGLQQVRDRPIKVEVDARATRLVRGCAPELREVLTNLVFNAADAMPQGGTLTVRTWSTDSEVFLAVADTGVGIPEGVRRRLFEPFFSTKGDRGTGLGLSVSFGIVGRHRGRIEVDSAVGRGSTFTVRLPAARADSPESAPPADEGLPALGKGLRLLVIEDDEKVRRFLGTGLSALGHCPRLAAGAEEGLVAFGQEPFDAVLTDLGLPGMSGEEVARSIAQRSPGTPVILLTGWAEQLKASARLVDGVARVLGKPVTLSTLATTLQQVCPR